MRAFITTLFVLGLLTLLGAVGMGAFIAQSSTDVASQPQVLAAQTATNDDVAAIDQIRVANGQAEVAFSAALQQIAELRAKDMRDTGYYAHTSPSGQTFIDYLTTDAYACENLQLQTTDDLEAALGSWLQSQSHKDCVLHSDVTQAGVAVLAYDTVVYGVRPQTNYVFVLILSQ